ncbi:MAG: DUF3800 domain-containing protein [Kiritimatiellae bacterium]|nr:DUF3800 domain-containing protein [Kiritimatiellia bacterium]
MDGKLPKTLSIFVDESGRFQFPDAISRFYILSIVLHDQGNDISSLVNALDRDFFNLGIIGQSFHAGPVIRQEKGYALMTWELRGRIFARMVAFARKAEFNYCCVHADKNFITSEAQLSDVLEGQLRTFADAQSGMFSNFPCVKIYYDGGQSVITNMLHRVFEGALGDKVVFAQDVRPEKYKLFQVADLLCTVELAKLKIETGIGLSKSESQFFGGRRSFLRNVAKPLLRKRIALK